MDKKTLVKELQKIIKEIEKEKGKFTLVILARMKDQWPPRRFRFAAVAPWIDEVGKRKAIEYLFPKLFANPDKDYLGSFADATVFFTKDPLVQDLLWEVGEDYEAPLTITGRTFDGIEFEEAILL